MQVFVSYSQANAEIAQELAKELQVRGGNVWSDAEVLPGENWASAHAAALQNSNAMLVLLTRESVGSRNLELEIGYALGQKSFEGRLIPVIADDLDMSQVPWILRTFKVYDLRPSLSQSVDDIATALKKGA